MFNEDGLELQLQSLGGVCVYRCTHVYNTLYPTIMTILHAIQHAQHQAVICINSSTTNIVVRLQ